MGGGGGRERERAHQWPVDPHLASKVSVSGQRQDAQWPSLPAEAWGYQTGDRAEASSGVRHYQSITGLAPLLPCSVSSHGNYTISISPHFNPLAFGIFVVKKESAREGEREKARDELTETRERERERERGGGGGRERGVCVWGGGVAAGLVWLE